MRVLQLTTHVNVGGISNYILTLSRELSAKGCRVIVASAGGDLEDAFKASGIRHVTLNIRTKFEFGPKALLSAFRVASLIRKEKIDVIHAHTRVSQVAGLIASRMTGVPMVTTCHGYFKKRLRKIVDTWGSRVIAISDAVKTHLAGDLGVAASRIRLVYSGVDPGRFSKVYSSGEIAVIRQEAGLRAGPVVGTIGRLSIVKGQRHLVEAMKDVIAARPDAQCLIIGNGNEEKPLKDLARSLGIADRVRFLDSCADTHRYLSAMDVFVFPSIKEGLGIALLEALASGRACVASRIGGIEDIIKDGHNGILAEVGDVKAIGEAIKKLLADDGLRQAMGQRGRALVSHTFTLDAMADGIMKVYEEAAW